MADEKTSEQLTADVAELEANLRAEREAHASTRDDVARLETLTRMQREDIATAETALRNEIARTHPLTELVAWVSENRNRSVAIYGSQKAAQGAADDANAKRQLVHPDTEIRVLRLADYVQQLEAAVMTLELLFAAQKAHMRQLWQDSKAVDE
jgi:hypothetical protein